MHAVETEVLQDNDWKINEIARIDESRRDFQLFVMRAHEGGDINAKFNQNWISNNAKLIQLLATWEKLEKVI